MQTSSKTEVTIVLETDEEVTAVCIGLGMLARTKPGQPSPFDGARAPITAEQSSMARRIHAQILEHIPS